MPTRGALSPFLYALLMLSAGACAKSEAETLVRVVIDSDLEVGSQLSKVEVRIFDPEGKEERRRQDFTLAKERSGTRYALPMSIKLVPDTKRSNSSDFLLVVTGIGPLGSDGSEVEIVEQQALASFRPGSALRLDIFLARSCLRQLCRDDDDARSGLTCEAESGACIEVPTRDGLPTVNGDGANEYDEGNGDAEAQGNFDASIGDAQGGNEPEDARIDSEVVGGLDGRVFDASADSDGDQLSETGSHAACTDDVCQHGGECRATPDQNVCDCEGTGYEGDRCEIDVNECASLNACASPDYPCEQTAAPGYTCRGLMADWHMPDLVAGAKFSPAYDTRVTGVVIDSVTGLWWQRSPPTAYSACATVRSTAPAESYCNAVEAASYCNQLELAGSSDWNLPSKIELESLLDHTSNANFIDAGAFAGSIADWYWTSSNVSGESANRWAVVFWSGNSEPIPATFGARVRCVRRPSLSASTPKDRYQTSSFIGVAIDQRTGLSWQRGSAASMNWSDALSYCSSLTLAGGGFRLPTVKELATLADPLRSNPAIDPDVFPSTQAYLYWSSSLSPSSQTMARRVVNFQTGAVGSYGEEQAARVRCVR